MDKLTVVEKLHNEAEAYMNKIKKKELRMAQELEELISELEEKVISEFDKADIISISYIETFIDTEITPIIEDYKAQQQELLKTYVTNQFNNGYTHAGALLEITPIEYESLTQDEINDVKEEVLLAILLLSKTLINSLNDDLLTKLKNNAITAYILYKKEQNNKNKSDDGEEKSTVNTILTGAIISEYISSSFKNIKNRANLITRTESNRAINQGHLFKYKEADINKVKWIPVYDKKVCDDCLAAARKNNGIYNIENLTTPPPLHPHCRCILIPYSIEMETLFIK